MRLPCLPQQILTADSHTLGTLEPGAEKGLRHLNVSPQEAMIYLQMQLNKAFERADEFDIIHSHVGQDALPYADWTTTSTLHTIHGFFPQLSMQMFKQYSHQNYVSISEAQQTSIEELNYIATVYNAIAVEKYPFYSQPEDPPYLAFLGRMSQSKGPHLAIEIAKQVGLPLKMAGKVDSLNQDFFNQTIAPLIDDQQIIFLGEVSHGQKTQLLGGALGTLFPITWDEPFGLVMIESMACGTPVIAMARGATPEIIIEGETGFLGNDIEELVAVIPRIANIKRLACRHHVMSHFTVKQMVDGYETVYEQLLRETLVKKGNVFSMISDSNVINELSLSINVN